MAALHGRTVVVTRPADQAADLIAALEQAGACPLAFPTLAIEPRPLEQADRDKITNLDQYHAIFCVSPNAAQIGLEALAEYWPQWPLQQQWIAVGPATGAAMAHWGIPVMAGPAGATSETILDYPEMNNVAGKKILILRGVGGRETMAETLRQRGASVDFLELYWRRLPEQDPAPLLSALGRQPAPILTVTSGDALRNLIKASDKQLNRLQQCPLVVISGRLAAFAQQQGFAQVWQAASPATPDIMAALQHNH